MKKTVRGYRKPEQHDYLENSVEDISHTFEMIDRDITEVHTMLTDATTEEEEILWQSIKNTSEISLMKGVERDA